MRQRCSAFLLRIARISSRFIFLSPTTQVTNLALMRGKPRAAEQKMDALIGKLRVVLKATGLPSSI